MADQTVNIDDVRRAFRADIGGREQFWSGIEIRDVGDSDGRPTMSGVASVFNERAKVKLPDGRIVMEQVAPTAFQKSLTRSDIFLLWQHDMATPLARTGAGNLDLRVTDRGLEFDAVLPNTQAARDAAALVRSGIVDKCSFGFVLPPSGGDKISFERDGTILRTLTNVGLRELSIVSSPAYQTTSAVVRSDALTLLCRSLGVDENDVIERVRNDQPFDFDTLRVSAASQRSVPSLDQTSEDAQGLVPPPAAGIHPSDSSALKRLLMLAPSPGDLPKELLRGVLPASEAG